MIYKNIINDLYRDFHNILEHTDVYCFCIQP